MILSHAKIEEIAAAVIKDFNLFSLAKKRAKQGQCRRELRLTSLPANISA